MQIQPPVKKVFNCIVDETALLAGAKKSTRDGIRKWITNEQIRLFVPLHTLNQATRLKDKAGGRVSTDAEEALLWLDDATTTAPHLVTLQGGYEKFDTWAEVEKFALPKPLFSEEDLEEYEYEEEDAANDNQGMTKLDKLDKHLSMSSGESDVTRSATPDSLHSMRSSMSPLSPPESPAKTAAKPHLQPIQKPAAKDTSVKSQPKIDGSKSASDSGVPPHFRSLFNYILWRVQQEIDPAAALESFIFLCDDPQKAKLAQRFGIRVKSLADIRFVVAREEREFRNRQLVQRKENEKAAAAAAAAAAPAPSGSGRPSTRASPIVAAASTTPALEKKDSSDDDGEIVFKRPPKAPAAMIAAQQSPRPNHKVMDPNHFSRSPGGRGNARGGGARGGRGTARAVANTGAGRGEIVSNITNSSNGPIDPNSFSRPPPNGGRFRGGARKLFIPT
ncbi:hypothetical protein BDV97DRAFT_377261 [Delphinella strobiligena]|nr:hypothetical protein BDV97DRAFT_377261 [Delphinella strobiligena]